MSNTLFVYVEPINQPFGSPYTWKVVSMNGDSYMKSAEGYSIHNAVVNLYRRFYLCDWLIGDFFYRIVNFEDMPEREQKQIVDKDHKHAIKMEDVR